MKRRIVAAMLAGVMALGMLAGCGGSGKSDSDGGSSDKKSSDANIAVFYYTYSDTYIASVRTALDAKLDEMGVEYQDYDGNSNQTTQNEQIDTAIQTGATALIVNIVTSGSVDASSQIVEKAEAAGIPVIFFNRAVEDDKTEGDVLGSYDKCAFVGTDAPEALLHRSLKKQKQQESRLSSLTVQSKMTKQKAMYLEAMTSVHS